MFNICKLTESYRILQCPKCMQCVCSIGRTNYPATIITKISSDLSFFSEVSLNYFAIHPPPPPPPPTPPPTPPPPPPHTHTHTRIHTRTHTHTLSLPPSPPLSLHCACKLRFHTVQFLRQDPFILTPCYIWKYQHTPTPTPSTHTHTNTHERAYK